MAAWPVLNYVVPQCPSTPVNDTKVQADSLMSRVRSAVEEQAYARASLETRLVRRHFLQLVVVLGVVAVELVAARTALEDGDPGVTEANAFAVACEVVIAVVVVVLASIRWCHSTCWARPRRPVLGLYAVLLWVLCGLVSVSPASSRLRLLGLVADDAGALQDRPCEDGPVAMWIAILLACVSVHGVLPLKWFVASSQLACLQHLVLGLCFPRPECERSTSPGPSGSLFGMSSLATSSLQLHALAALLSFASRQHDAERALEDVLTRFQAAATSQVPVLGEGQLNTGVELASNELQTEELQCRRFLTTALRSLPPSEVARAWVDSVDIMIGKMSSVSARLQSCSDEADIVGVSNSHDLQHGNYGAFEGFLKNEFLKDKVLLEPSKEDTLTPRSATAKSSNRRPSLAVVAEAAVKSVGRPSVVTPAGEVAILGARGNSPLEDEDSPFPSSYPSEHGEAREAAVKDFGKWSLDAISVDKALDGRILMHLGVHLLASLSMVEHAPLVRLLERLEVAYVKDNPYHSHVHAADVCNNIFTMLTRMALWDHQHFSETRRFSILVAALGHDVGHFGRNNHFLMHTGHELALRYNDRSVMENYHAATLWSFLRKDENPKEKRADEGERAVETRAMMDNVPSDSYSKVRQLVLALILATDTQSHLEALSSFRLRLNACESSAGALSEVFDPLKSPKDQQEALCFLFRAADIGHSAKPWPIHEEWSIRVTQEFHQQGDEEIRLGIPVSPLCSREGFKLAESQMGFLQFICIPTWREVLRLQKIIAALQEEAAAIEDAAAAAAAQVALLEKYTWTDKKRVSRARTSEVISDKSKVKPALEIPRSSRNSLFKGRFSNLSISTMPTPHTSLSLTTNPERGSHLTPVDKGTLYAARPSLRLHQGAASVRHSHHKRTIADPLLEKECVWQCDANFEGWKGIAAGKPRKSSKRAAGISEFHSPPPQPPGRMTDDESSVGGNKEETQQASSAS